MYNEQATNLWQKNIQGTRCPVSVELDAKKRLKPSATNCDWMKPWTQEVLPCDLNSAPKMAAISDHHIFWVHKMWRFPGKK